MKAVDYLKAKGRMTKKCNIGCAECLLDKNYNDKNIECVNLEGEYPKKAVEIVEKWAKENPPKTYLSVLLEKFPNVELSSNEVPILCPYELFDIDGRTCPGCTCVECWNREYKEE